MTYRVVTRIAKLTDDSNDRDDQKIIKERFDITLEQKLMYIDECLTEVQKNLTD